VRSPNLVGESQTAVRFSRKAPSNHPEWDEDRIALEFWAKLGVECAPSTISRCLATKKEHSTPSLRSSKSP
jgi:hypothetical protein